MRRFFLPLVSFMEDVYRRTLPLTSLRPVRVSDPRGSPCAGGDPVDVPIEAAKVPPKPAMNLMQSVGAVIEHACSGSQERTLCDEQVRGQRGIASDRAVSCLTTWRCSYGLPKSHAKRNLNPHRLTAPTLATLAPSLQGTFVEGVHCEGPPSFPAPQVHTPLPVALGVGRILLRSLGHCFPARQTISVRP